MDERELELWIGNAIVEKSLREFDERLDNGESPSPAALSMQRFQDAGLKGHGLVFSLENGAEVILRLTIGPPEVDSRNSLGRIDN